jgi:hypothetical protein
MDGNTPMFTFLCKAWPIELLAIVYLLSMYFLIRLFAKTYIIIKQHPGNGLQFYRNLVAISIAVAMVDATYVIVSRLLHWFYPEQDYMLYGIIPTVVKTVILFCIWGFYTVQDGKTPVWFSWKYWKDKLGL